MTATLDRLRLEFGAEPDSFLITLRIELTWDPVRFTRLVTAMHDHVATVAHGPPIERWIAEGFWYLQDFAPGWSQHDSFPRPHPEPYYDAAYERLHDLAFWLFVGESPYEEGRGFEELVPAAFTSAS